MDRTSVRWKVRDLSLGAREEEPETESNWSRGLRDVAPPSTYSQGRRRTQAR